MDFQKSQFSRLKFEQNECLKYLYSLFVMQKNSYKFTFIIYGKNKRNYILIYLQKFSIAINTSIDYIILIKDMGGDLFEGTQKLTNQEYEQLTLQLIKILQPYCQRIQPYTPMPQKPIHGDIDFIVLLKLPFTQTNILNELKPAQQKISNNQNSINTVYKNKQVDFLFVRSHKQFDMVWFYKSYSGLGGYLGVFFPSKIIKVTHKGLFAPICYFHLKVQLLVSDDVEKIMQFYGLDYQRHKQGYKTRKELYEYLRTVKFLDEARYVEEVKQVKGTSKLMWGMVEYLKQTGIDQQRKFFSKTEAYDLALTKLINFKKKNQEMNKKFNARHILQHFDIPIKKQVDHMKVKFKTVMFEQDQHKYLEYVESHSVEEILEQFGKVCGLKVIKKEKEKIIEETKNEQCKQKQKQILS